MALFALAGCASAPQAPTSVALDLGAERSFTFKSVDEDGKKIEGSIASSLVDAIYESSGYGRKIEKRSSFGQGAFDIQGIEVATTPNALKLSYVNGQRYELTGTTLTRSNVIFGYHVEVGANSITVKVVPPNQIETIKGKNLISLSFNQFDSDENLAKDVKKIFNNINPVVNRSKSFKGEIDVKYSVDAITTNFKRKCGYSFAGKSFADKNGFVSGFQCTIEGAVVNIAVFPYKEGAKVTYNFPLLYSLNGKGESSYKSELPKNIIASFEKIVND
ncbi:MAG: hypothetical protein NUV63_11865 [Gallionella sp.]|nr:hypothetical protein [Gallionella sp.]